MTHFVSLRFDPNPNVDGCGQSINAALNKLNTTAGLDTNAQMAAAIDTGKLILLGELNGTWPPTGAPDLHLNFYPGLSSVDGCEDHIVTKKDVSGAASATSWDGVDSCEWEINPSALEAGSCPDFTLPKAKVSNGQLSLSFSAERFLLPVGDAFLEVQVANGQLKAALTDDFRLTSGHICGAVPASSLSEAMDDLCGAFAATPLPSACFGGGLWTTSSFAPCVDGMCSFTLTVESAPASGLSIGAPPP